MSSLFSQEPEDGLGADLPVFDDLTTAGRRPVRSLLFAAAGVAVIAGGAAGFLWLGSAPSADASALGASGSTSRSSSSPQVTSDPAVLDALSGREVFAAASGAAEAVVDTTATSEAATTAATSASAVSTGAVSSGGGRSGSTGTATSSAAVPTTKAPSGSGGAKAPVATSTTPPAPVTPTPSRSTAPAWDMSVYTYTGTDAEHPSDGNFTMAPSAVGQSYGVQIDEGDVLYPADITFQREVTGGAWITSNRGVPQGWVVPAGSAVPDAAMGRTTGTVRVVGVVNSKQVYVQVNRGPSILLKIGEAVEGTPLTFVGFQAAGLPEGPAYFTDAKNVTYYGAVGSAETDGVTF
ncbi:hypothetical protein [Kineococcus sp. SYSU DK002]|uniref:hypothetical protein n=1 Tax=Kineococcus sp. SYSU DK002 TaxID=3383123 RepID=UPI003D7CCC4E